MNNSAAGMTGLYVDTLGTAEIERFTQQLASLTDRGPLDALVPTCGAWTIGDLAWHLLEVQDFWSYIIENRPAGPAEYAMPTRPSDDDLAPSLRSGVLRLAQALDSCGATTPAWSWHPADQSVGFSIRRQTHEALVHCCDGALALGAALPSVSAELAADGVDEMVNIMLCGVPDGAGFTRTSGIVKLHATDTSDDWCIAVGELVGQADTAGTRAFELAEGEEPDLTISAPALDLNLWLWGRPTATEPVFDGDAALIDQLRAPID